MTFEATHLLDVLSPNAFETLLGALARSRTLESKEASLQVFLSPMKVFSTVHATYGPVFEVVDLKA